MSGESAKAFSAFAHYRDCGPARSLMKTARHLRETTARTGKVEGIQTELGKWASKWRWADRIEAFEIEMDRRHVEATIAARHALDAKHLEMTSAMSDAVLLRLKGGEDYDGRNIAPLRPGQIRDWTELTRVGVEAAKLERLVRGLPTDISRALTHVPASEVATIVRALVEASLAFIPEEEQTAWLTLAAGICNRGR